MAQQLSPSNIGDVRLVESSLLVERADCGHLETSPKYLYCPCLNFAGFAFVVVSVVIDCIATETGSETKQLTRTLRVVMKVNSLLNLGSCQPITQTGCLSREFEHPFLCSSPAWGPLSLSGLHHSVPCMLLLGEFLYIYTSHRLFCHSD